MESSTKYSYVNSDISEEGLTKTETCTVLNNQHINNIEFV